MQRRDNAPFIRANHSPSQKWIYQSTSSHLPLSRFILFSHTQSSQPPLCAVRSPRHLPLPTPSLLHDTHVGGIYTPSNHFWSNKLYSRKPSSSPVLAAVSRIPNSWHHQCQHRHVCVLWHGMPQAKEGMYIPARELL